MSGIADAMEQAIAYLRDHPDEARYTDSVAKATLEDGLRCRVEGPNGESTVTDMAKSVGGGESAPSPGWLFRAAVASCNATLIAMRAAQEGVVLSGLEVEVDSESDDRGILGMDPSIPAGPYSMNVRVRASTNGGGDEKLPEIIESGVAHCPVCDAVKRDVEVRLEILP